MKENEVMIYGVKSKNNYKYIGKTRRDIQVNGKIKNANVKAQYNNKPLRDVFVNYENVSVEPIILVPESQWYPEKLREVVAHNQHPLLNAKWMLEGKRGYWEGKKRDSHTLLMLSQSKFKQYVEYDKQGKLKKVWIGGKNVAKQIFGDYQVVDGCGKTKFYEVAKSSSVKKRFAHGSYWFRFEELILHFNGIPAKINIQAMIKREQENKRLRRVLTYKKKTTCNKYIVECYDRKSGKLITVYKNSEEAGYMLKVHKDLIRRFCTNKIRPARDYIFKYGEKLEQPKASYPNYVCKEIPRVEVDTESLQAKKKELLRLQKEHQRLEIENRLLTEQRRLVEERKERLASNLYINLHIEDLDDKLSVRTRNCLRYANINTVAELIQYDVEHLMYIRNFGVKCLSEIQKMLSNYKLELLDEKPIEKPELTEKVVELLNNNPIKATDIRIANINAFCYTLVGSRTINCLKQAGINTIGELIQYSENDLMHLRNFGVRCLSEVQKLLREYNLNLK